MSGAALYLHLCAMGLSLRLVDDPDRPDGHAIKVGGLNRLEPLARSRARHRIRAHRPALVALLTSGSPAAVAVRAEAAWGDDKAGKKEAAT